jgi:hypothetical protein
MTPLFVLLLLAEEPAPQAEHAFGRASSAKVRSVDPDANHHQGDGAYGRFDGDLELGLGAGGMLAFSDRALGVAVRGDARWYSTAALYGQYAEALSDDPRVERRLGVGVELTPLFLIRWSQALETGPAVVDLALDSLSLGLGMTFATPRERGFASRKAFEGSLGVGVPLLGTATGPWLELRAALVLPQPAAGEANATLLFSWHGTLTTPLVKNE